MRDDVDDDLVQHEVDGGDIVRGQVMLFAESIDGLAEPPDLAPLIDNDDREVANLHL